MGIVDGQKAIEVAQQIIAGRRADISLQPLGDKEVTFKIDITKDVDGVSGDLLRDALKQMITREHYSYPRPIEEKLPSHTMQEVGNDFTVTLTKAYQSFLESKLQAAVMI